MSDEVRQAALKAVAAIAALEAVAVDNLWDADARTLAAARGVAQSLTRR